MSWRTSETVCLALASSLALAGCNQLEAIETEGGASGGAGGIPPAVRTAFEETCGKGGCHAPGGTAPTLAGDALDEILSAQADGVPYVTLGDTAKSYIAIVMMPDALLSALGLSRTVGRMPFDGDFLNPNNQVILSWIAGAEFEGGGTTGEPATTGETETGGSSTGAAAEPTFANVQAIIDANCSCHFAPPNMATNGNLQLTMGDSYAQLVNVKAPSVALDLVEPGDPSASYLYLKLAGGFQDAGGAGSLMPPAMGLMDEAKIMLVEEWILAGAMDN